MKVLFFGTPSLSVPFLERLIVTETVVGVVTQPDKPAARGCHLRQPPVKERALAHQLPVFQPGKISGGFRDRISDLAPDIGVVIAYGKLIPEPVFTLPFYGCFNIHFSLLPKYRGAAPVQWALINGEKQTGVTTFWLERTLDSGPVLEQEPIPVLPEDDAQSLFGKLIPLGVDVMTRTLDRIKAGRCAGAAQAGDVTFAPSLDRDTGHIRWDMPAERIIDLMRGTRPWPGTYTVIASGPQEGRRLKILAASVASGDEAGQMSYAAPGAISALSRNRGFVVRCGAGALLIEEVQPENKKPMSAWSYLQGGHISPGTLLA